MTFFGLPIHPLIVHAAVILVPLAAVGALATIFVRWVRVRYGSLVAVTAVAAALSAIAARLSGEAFLATMGVPTPRMLAHANWGLIMPWPATALAISTVIYVITALRLTGKPTLAYWLSAGITGVLAVATLVLIGLTGHSGAFAVWGR